MGDLTPAEAAPCRVCGAISYLADERGPVHLCCSRLPDGATSCGPCRAAELAEAEWQSRGKRRSKERAEQAARIVAAGS